MAAPALPRLLDRAFYARPAEAVARGLLGAYLVHQAPAGRAAGRIVEVEAYVGPHDQASHARRGPTPRNRVMYGPPGHAYVYLIYGVSCLFNVICGRQGYPAGVLVRALEPAEGATLATDGPGKLTRALGITLAENTVDLVGGRLWIERRDRRRVTIATTARINVDFAGPEWSAAPLRFVDAHSPWLSRRLPGSLRRRGPRPRAAAAGPNEPR